MVTRNEMTKMWLIILYKKMRFVAVYMWLNSV